MEMKVKCREQNKSETIWLLTVLSALKAQRVSNKPQLI